MANAVDKIAKGDLRIDKIYYNRQDEIGTLANGINSMVKALKDLVGQINLSAQEVSLSGETLLPVLMSRQRLENKLPLRLCILLVLLIVKLS